MVLDALIKIKAEQEPGLTFRRSCRRNLRLLRHEHQWDEHPSLPLLYYTSWRKNE